LDIASAEATAGQMGAVLRRFSNGRSDELTYFSALLPSDFDPFTITAPADSRLPGGGANVISGLYNVRPTKFTVPADNFVTFAESRSSTGMKST
jgi:hypothetical protein